MKKNANIFNQIAEALLMDYSNIYFVNARTNAYQGYAFNAESRSLEPMQEGEDFFQDVIRDAEDQIYEEDKFLFTERLTKADILEELKQESMHSFKYRLMIDGQPVWHTLRLIQEEVDEEDYFILGVLNIDEEERERQAAEALQEERRVYTQITERLALNYDAIYYVNVETGLYISFVSGDIYGKEGLRTESNDFFYDSRRNAEDLIHPDDKATFQTVLDKDYLITTLENKKQFAVEYTMIVDGKPQHARMTVMWSNDRAHFIICVENIESEFRREMEQNRVLKTANELARTDELTRVKNKNAYNEFEKKLQKMLNEGSRIPFAIVVCDLNDLKSVNDTLGHKEGDNYIIRASRMVCKVFAHSPVFRIGGDEFAVVLMNKDYNKKIDLFERFRQQMREHLKNQDGPVLASGMAAYNAEKHDSVADVFRQADEMMYEDKRLLKSGDISGEDLQDRADWIIPEERLRMLDDLFDALKVVAEGAYVYLCDMRHDYSRWDAAAVDLFGMPSEYMYDAGYVWEQHIHPEDRGAYHEAMDEIFFGGGLRHDMQYRAKDAKGEYVVCSCRGIVLRDRTGESEYFCGTIRKHGIQEHIDALTGLRNQYGFFEDIQGYLHRKQNIQIVMIGISRFSELNDVYGYQFGNLLLQKVGRYLFEHVGNRGEAYRLDGTKFAVIMENKTEEEVIKRYEDLRAIFRDGFTVDDRYIILETNAGLLMLDSFDIDDRTVYSCLNFAYSQSKNLHQGDLVTFRKHLNEENQDWINRIQAIRASITRNCDNYYLVYQPVVDAQTERIASAEALLRWEDQVYGLVPPDEFIDVIEKDSLFPELGRWILRTALLDAKKVLEEIPEFIISVNLSYTQLGKPSFVDTVFALLEETDFPPEHLCLEITERCRMLDLALLTNVVAALRAKGVRVALDDFGTGFSSVGVIRDIPLDVIKIDRSFIQDIEVNEDHKEMIGSFVKVASLYGAYVCVEGIETAQMRRKLLDYPVSRLQGYYYSKPLRVEEFIQWARENRQMEHLETVTD